MGFYDNPLFSINLQTATTCNGICKVCDHKWLHGNNTQYMKPEVWNTLLNEINKFKIKPTVVLCFTYEPMTDILLGKRITDLKYIDKDLPIIMITNGQLINEKFKYLWDLLEIHISILGGVSGEYSYENITGWNLNKTINIIITNYLKGLPINVLLTVADLNNIELILDKLQLLDIPVKLNKISGISVQFDNNKLKTILAKYSNLQLSWNYSSSDNQIVYNLIDMSKDNMLPCDMLHKVLAIDINGNIRMCHIAHAIAGNVLNHTIEEIYYGSSLTTARTNIENGIYGHDECKYSCKFKYIL